MGVGKKGHRQYTRINPTIMPYKPLQKERITKHCKICDKIIPFGTYCHTCCEFLRKVHAIR